MAGILDAVDNWFDQNSGTRAVYNSQGRAIGYFTDLASLAAGKWQIYKGETPVDFTTIKIKQDFFSGPVNATEWLVAHGYVPAWLPAEQKTALVSKDVPSLDSIVAAQVIKDNPVPVMAIAGFGLLAAVILLRR